MLTIQSAACYLGHTGQPDAPGGDLASLGALLLAS